MDQGTRSLIDLNRCGVGLMEIVFAPDLYDGEQAVGLVRELPGDFILTMKPFRVAISERKLS